ncbi:MAG: hypothetical protein IJP29_00845 [Lachnospiraceae bacterium]|nr:hypothetical protein [Lachnospiraceae bacterium]
MKKGIIIFIVILILALGGLYGYMTNPFIQEKIASITEEDFSEENIYSDLENLSVRLDEEIMNGEESFTVYLKDMDLSAIDQINDSLSGVYGSGTTYQQVGAIGDTYKKVTITVGRTTNYYAVKAYLNQEPIPATEQKAQQLYQVICQVMANYVDESMTDFEKEIAIHDYLVKNCRYSEDTTQPSGSDIFRAYGALVNKDAVCNGYAEALHILFTCAGLETQFVVGTADGVDHAWNLVQLDGEWYHLDATWNDPVPDQKNTAIHAYFNVPDDIMSVTHVWEQERYPKARSMDYNYYAYHNLYFDNFMLCKDNAYTSMVTNKNDWYEAAVKNYVENENDMQFVFENNNMYESVSWKMLGSGEYCVLVIEAD